ncbi:hypothetical protein [Paenibacillus abyssi]|uniref:Uncharacterized protein n=1 Tax=Paenibacillus abyssi TaxID=1340531 RepID=A0A917D3Y4_9BACL|nr:hypothetical protein [Paenibacillus abyssi]GGG10397.1 hypothetical protein GCM10010916_29070 [Paenibacillus abyssi]
MRTVMGLQMDLPQGKLPGFYAQIIKGIADITTLIDRSGELLFIEPQHAAAVMKVLQHYKVEAEQDEWIELSEPDWRLEAIWEDYGVTARAGGKFAELRLACVGAVYPADSSEELEQAWMQIEEHNIASLQTAANRRLFVVDRQLAELIEGIAKAYRCNLEWLY